MSWGTKKTKDFSYFNLNLNNADLQAINDELKEVDINELYDLCQPDPDGSKFAELIRLTILQLCYKHVPIKDFPNSGRARINKDRRALHRKKRKLKITSPVSKPTNPSPSPTIAPLTTTKAA